MSPQIFFHYVLNTLVAVTISKQVVYNFMDWVYIKFNCRFSITKEIVYETAKIIWQQVQNKLITIMQGIILYNAKLSQQIF